MCIATTLQYKLTILGCEVALEGANNELITGNLALAGISLSFLLFSGEIKKKKKKHRSLSKF